MKFFKKGVLSTFCGLAISISVPAVTAQTAQTNPAVIVRHAPDLNGSGRIEGSLQQLLGEDVILNGGFVMTGDLLVPGTPSLRLNGHPTFAGTIAGTGSASPTGYGVTLNGTCSLRYLRTRTAPVMLATVPAPPSPAGTRNVILNAASQSIGTPATLRNLTLNGNVGQIAVPPGTYGAFTANGASGFTLGVAGATQPAVYNLQSFTLNGQSRVDVVGPVVLTVANGFSANGLLGTTNRSSWLHLQFANGSLTLNGGCTVHGNVAAPAGTVIVNGNSCLIGSAQCDRLIVNGGGVIRAGAPPNQPPVATPQSLSVAEDTRLNITLAGSDPEGSSLTYILVDQPSHGRLDPQSSGASRQCQGGSTTNQFIYAPATNYNGPDRFTFKVNDGQTDSAPAAISITVTPVNDRPVATPQTIATDENTAVIFTLGGADVDGDALTCQPISQPAHGIVGTRIAALNQFIYTPARDFYGNDSFLFVANDGKTNSAAAAVNITVRRVNQPPVVSAGPDQTILFPNPVRLGGSAVDDGLPAGGTLSVVWSLVSGPGPVNFEKANTTNTLATFSQSGVYTLRLTASDGLAASSAVTTVTVDRPPSVTLATPASITWPGNQLVLSGAVADDGLPPGRNLSVAWNLVSGPGTASFSPASQNNALIGAAVTNQSSTRASFSAPGLYVVRLIADDGLGTNEAEAGVLITHANVPPTVSITRPPPGSESDAGQAIPVEVTAADSDGQVAGVTLLDGDRVLAAFAEPPFRFTWTNAMAGTHVLSAMATDDSGASSFSSNVLVSVLESENGDFSVEAGPDQVISMPGSAALAGALELSGPASGVGTNVTWSVAGGPGDVRFSSPGSLLTTAQFGAPGTYTLKLRVNHGGGTRSDTLTVDVLPAAPNRLTAARSNHGADFWLMFLPNMEFSGEMAYVGCNLIISADADTTGKVTFSRWDEPGEIYFRVKAGTSTNLSLWDYPREDWDESDSIQPNGVHFTADHAVTVFGLNYMPMSADGFLAFPTSMLGTNHMVLSYRNSPTWYDTNVVIGGTEFGMVAPQDDTHVTITPTAATETRPAGDSYGILLQRGETYRSIDQDGADADFTGTTIVSDKPVAVFAGHRATLVPAGCAAADHLIEQLPPIEMWGRQFVTMPLATRVKGDTFRCLAQTNGTRVAVNGRLVATLGRGRFYETMIEGPARILSSQPILVAQYANGSDYDDTTGDPFMTLIPPVEQFGGDYILSTALPIWNLWDQQYEDLYTNYLNLVVRTNGIGLIQINGVDVPTNAFQRIGDTGYAGVQLPVDPGSHHLSAPVPFGACIYGWGWYVSYAFMGGVYSETVDAGAILRLEQPTPFAQTGNEKIATACVADARGQPLGDVGVDFLVSGANAASGHVITSRFGEATFSYTGTNAGVDVIAATLVDLEESLTNTWLAPGNNASPIVSTKGTQPLALGMTVQLAGTATDDGNPRGANLKVGWRLLDGLAAVEIENAAQISTRAFCTEPGTYSFELAADDSQLSSRAVATVFVDLLPAVQFPTGQLPDVALVNSSIQLNADAWDTDGSIDRVEFYCDDLRIGTAVDCDPWTGYTIDWTPATNGWFKLRAVAFDDLGGSVSSDTVLIEATFPPRIEADLPDHDLTLPYNASTATFRARAWDPDGTVTNFAVFLGPALIDQVAGDRIDFTGPADVGGNFYEKYGTPQPVRFVATDNHGVSTETDTVNITLAPPAVTVDWISPALNQTFRVGQMVNLVAEASVMPPARIWQVVFYLWNEPPPWMPWASGRWVAVDYPATDEPYINRWTPTAPGDYQFKTVSWADTGTSSPELVITLHVLPAIGVSIVPPADSAQLFAGNSWQISLELDDPTSAFDHAEFFANGVGLGQTTNHSIAWLPQDAGNYTLTAAVFDHRGQSYDSEHPVSVQVRQTPIPSISLETIPEIRTNLLVGFPLLLVADISMTNPVPVAKVEFFADDRSLGEMTNAPFLFPYIATNPGPHCLTARVTTEYGAAADSAPICIENSLRLGVSWEGVHPGEWVPVGTNKTLGVRLYDPGSIFDHIEFVANGVVLGSTPFCFLDWTPSAAGEYALRARAHDRFGNTYDSEEITLHSALLHHPEVHFLSPAPMARFSFGQPVPFSVQATDPDGVVTNLSLFRHSRPRVSIAGVALNCAWTNLPAGELQFTVVATDDKGLTGEAKLRIVVDCPFASDLLPPQDLSAQVPGCNAIRISWNTNSGTATSLVVVERAESTNEIWEVAGKVPVEKGVVEDHFLHAATVYRYRAYLRNAAGYRSPDSTVVVARTRAWIPGFAVLDIAENLEDTGAFDVASDHDNEPGFRGRRCETAEITTAAPVRQFTLAATKFHDPNARPIPGLKASHEPDRADLRSAWTRSSASLPDSWSRMPEAPLFASFVSESDSDAAVIPLDAFSTLGISDLDSVLVVGSVKTYVWSPGGAYEVLDDTNFFPFRMTRSGYPVGTRWTQVPAGPMNVVTQLHAGFWHEGFVDLTPDVQALRFPMSFPPASMPYSTYDVLSDMNSNGTGVGTASWVWVTSLDGQTSFIMLGPVRQATCWPGNTQPPVSFGALQELNSISESAFQAINDSGDIVGVSAVYDPNLPDAQITHAVRSHTSLADAADNKLTDLGTLGGFYSAALAINNAGVAVGYSTSQPADAITNARAVYWLPTESQPRRLPGYSDNLLTYARAINDDNQIVGEAVDTNGMQQAVLWKPNPAASGLDYDLVTLNNLVSSSDWNLLTAHSINSHGLVVGSGLHRTEVTVNNGASQTAMVPRAFLLLPNASLAVDYNRDGRIELDEKDDLPDRQPYQFWINDDSDNSTTASALGISDLPGARSGAFEFDGRDPDYADDKVNGAGDLVDWFPVWLNISNLLAVFPSAQYEYRLVHSEGALNFLYTALRPEEAGSYLTNASALGFGPDFNQPAATAAGVRQVTADGVVLSAVFLDKITRGQGGVLLFEARQATTQPLRLEVRSRRRTVTALELPLRISGAESMYAWVNLRGAAGEEVERPADLFPQNWPPFAKEDQAFVFLHGYNVNERQSRAWAAEMFKRLWWSGSHRRFYAVSWYGEESQVAGQTTINYHVNVRHAFETAPVLAFFLNNNLAGQDITLAAHSLGNMVACSAIQDYEAMPDRFFMLDAAVAMEAFDAGLTNQPFMTHPDWRDYPERLYASEWFRLFPDDDGRHALTWRGRFQDVPQLTDLYNFYSSGEEVLENRQDDSDPWISDIASFQLQWPTFRLPVNWLTGRYAWVLQETLKGRVRASDVNALYAKGYLIGNLPVLLALRLADVRAGNLVGSEDGGWGFNSYWDTSGSMVTITGCPIPTSVYIPGGHEGPAQAAGIADVDLWYNPFFLPFLDARLTTSSGGPVASYMRAQLLAEAIPARTFAAGANGFSKDSSAFAQNTQFDMNAQFQKRGWPEERLRSPRELSRWKHSDLHDMAYPYTGMAFDEFVKLEGGR